MAPDERSASSPALRFADVDLDREATPVLRGVNWQVSTGERWAVIGPNGSGKTTLMQLASGYLHPTRGAVEVLSQRLGRTDVRALRKRVSTVSASVARVIVPWLTAKEVVVSAREGALEPWWHTYSAPEWARAEELLAAAGFGNIAGRPFGVLSEGERQQVLLAMALMTDPELLLLDEPCAGLDMGGRERLLARLGPLAAGPASAPIVMVTHHVEEIPEGFTHVLLLHAGSVLSAGPIASALTAKALSECFGLPLELRHDAGRWTSRSARTG
jgi:iron complex transport system ATP-binding protein